MSSFILMSYKIFFCVSIIHLSILGDQSRSPYSKLYAKYKGDIYLAGLFSLHHRTVNGTCGSLIEQDGLQVLAAAVYGLELFANLTMLPIKIGLLSIDTCQDTEYVIEQSREFMQFKISNVENTYTCPNGSIPTIKEEIEAFQNVFGVFGAGNSDVSMAVSTYLKLIRLPQLSYFSTSHLLSDPDKYPTFFRTIPGDQYLIKAIIQLLAKYEWTYLLIVNDESEYSQQMTNKFQTTLDNDPESSICIAETFTIKKKCNGDRFNFIKNLKKKVNESVSARIILTFLTQPVAEDLLDYLHQNSFEELGKLLWIATDSWGGRNWPNMINNTALLNHTIAVIPKAHNNTKFMNYYKSRLPSVINNDPWLAKRFEEICTCQYQNISSFIYIELEKIRTPNLTVVSCEIIESECADKVYKDSQQMLYIHYVIDGIYAYAYTLQQLIPKNCSKWTVKECVKFMFKSGILNMANVVAQMKKIEFNDSTGEPFKFFGHDGAPKYSIIYFNNSVSQWKLVGNISVLEKEKMEVENSFDNHLKENHKVPICAAYCSSREAESFIVKDCCWKCTLCKNNEIIVENNSTIVTFTRKKGYRQQVCSYCGNGKQVNTYNNTCENIPVEYMSFDDNVAISLILINMLGLMSCLISCTIMIIYWKTPIIKALGRETSTIILIGTILSFVMSIMLLDKPNNLFCYIRWCSPGICSTLCYAAILTKLNRIARIFGINISSKKKLRFVSAISQINIVLIITAVECAIITTVMVSSDIKITYGIDSILNCEDIDISKIVAIFLIPSFLLICSTVYAFKIRKTPDGFNETRNINFLNFTNCVVLVTCLLLHLILKGHKYSVLPFCMLLTLGGHGNLLGLFLPKIYIILFRPSKNTRQAILTKSRSRSELSFSQSPSFPAGLDAQNPNIKNLKCRRCNLPLVSNVELETLPRKHSDSETGKDRSKAKVNFASTPNSDTNSYNILEESSEKNENETDNKTYIDDL